MQRCIIMCLAVSFLLSANIYAQEPEPSTETLPPAWEATSSITYSTGDFGTSTTTNTWYLPTTIRRYFSRGDASLTIPFIDQTTGPGVAAFRGRPFQISSNTSGDKESATGLGDVLLDGRYYIFNENTEAFNLSGLGRIKFPTADEDKGLGSGEFDETVGLESSKKLNNLWSVYADLYYTFIGEPPNTDLDNQVMYDLGVGYNLTEKTMASLFYREYTALVDDQDNARDISVGVDHKITNATKLFSNAAFGLTEGSPDFAITGGLGYLF